MRQRGCIDCWKQLTYHRGWDEMGWGLYRSWPWESNTGESRVSHSRENYNTESHAANSAKRIDWRQGRKRQGRKRQGPRKGFCTGLGDSLRTKQWGGKWKKRESRKFRTEIQKALAEVGYEREGEELNLSSWLLLVEQSSVGRKLSFNILNSWLLLIWNKKILILPRWRGPWPTHCSRQHMDLEVSWSQFFIVTWSKTFSLSKS